jgi:condensin complex subunit 2
LSGRPQKQPIKAALQQINGATFVQVKFAKRAKHVDVLNLKAGVWRELQRTASQASAPHADQSNDAARAQRGAVRFQDIVQGLCSGDGGRVEDISVHLCFICLLHLANEHELAVKSAPSLDELLIWRPVGQAA